MSIILETKRPSVMGDNLGKDLGGPRRSGSKSNILHRSGSRRREFNRSSSSCSRSTSSVISNSSHRNPSASIRSKQSSQGTPKKQDEVVQIGIFTSSVPPPKRYLGKKVPLDNVDGDGIFWPNPEEEESCGGDMKTWLRSLFPKRVPTPSQPNTIIGSIQLREMYVVVPVAGDGNWSPWLSPWSVRPCAWWQLAWWSAWCLK
ncbi:expressed unknown protein [Seminavis robusta]|uniref:Uncharacterized protein n=1 Tax=Seminavis robusta TaxID=568900 RepID=A0A9N8DZF4_9STRA|nr:expressed unknown protein [Seminavis robusta]|eukprot:Sro398_g134711.1  (202) ;mRNA; r:47579-48184